MLILSKLSLLLVFVISVGAINSPHGPCEVQFWPYPYSTSNGSSVISVDPSNIQVEVITNNVRSQKIQKVIQRYQEVNFYQEIYNPTIQAFTLFVLPSPTFDEVG